MRVMAMIALALAPLGSVASAQDSLPFPPVPSGSKAGPTIKQSTYTPRAQPRRLPEDAPNILIIMHDDVGPALPDTYGGDIHTPTLSRIAKSGISYNRFHNAAMCSPTRAALLTGRNPPPDRFRPDCRAGERLGRLHGAAPGDRGVGGEGARLLRLQDGGLRQVAQHAGGGNDPAGPVRPLADRAPGRLRLLLRLPGGRVVAMGAGGGREHRAPPRAAPRGLPLHRGHGRQGGDLDSPAPGARPGDAVLHVLDARRRARAAPHLQGVGRQVPRQVRRRLGRDAHPHLRAAEAARAGSRRTRSSRRARPRWPRGRTFPRTRSRSSAA